MYENLMISDIQCPICLDIFLKPVSLPCEHVFCETCLRNTVEFTTFNCPKCRKRIGTFLRRNKNIINEQLWNAIQDQFSEQVLQKQNGEETGIYEFLNISEVVPLPSYNPGEIKQEFQRCLKEELEKERIRREKEEEASALLAKQLQEEEDKLEEERRKQLQIDERLARIFAEETVSEADKNRTNETPRLTRSQTKSATKSAPTPKSSSTKCTRSLNSYFKIATPSKSDKQTLPMTSTPKSTPNSSAPSSSHGSNNYVNKQVHDSSMMFINSQENSLRVSKSFTSTHEDSLPPPVPNNTLNSSKFTYTCVSSGVIDESIEPLHSNEASHSSSPVSTISLNTLALSPKEIQNNSKTDSDNNSCVDDSHQTQQSHDISKNTLSSDNDNLHEGSTQILQTHNNSKTDSDNNSCLDDSHQTQQSHDNSKNTLSSDNGNLHEESTQILQTHSDSFSNCSANSTLIKGHESEEIAEDETGLDPKDYGDLLKQEEMLINAKENIELIEQDRLLALQLEKEWSVAQRSLRKRTSRSDTKPQENKKMKTCSGRKNLKNGKTLDVTNKQKTLCSTGCSCNK